MPLSLVTDTVPGVARWEEVGGGSGSLVLIVEISAAGAAPVISPTGLQNICYVLTQEIGGALTIVLPEITPTLPPTWRITWGGDLSGAEDEMSISPDGTNLFANSPNDTTTYILGNNGELATYSSATFVHDGDNQWAIFPGA